MSEYRDPIIAKIIEKLEAAGPPELRGHYFYGDILIVPKEELPAVGVAKDNTRIYPADNHDDEHHIAIVINVLYDYTADLDQSSDMVAGITGLYKLCEERDETYQLKPETLVYQLRKNETLDDNLWLAVGPNEEINVDYGLGINRRGPGIFSTEAVIRISAKLHKTRVSRL